MATIPFTVVILISLRAFSSPPDLSASSITLSERVSASLNFLRDYRQGILDACWTALDLSPDDYDNSWTVLATDLSLKGYFCETFCACTSILPILSSWTLQESFDAVWVYDFVYSYLKRQVQCAGLDTFAQWIGNQED
jgi:hypothetical protein